MGLGVLLVSLGMFAPILDFIGSKISQLQGELVRFAQLHEGRLQSL